jgi:hypothetical protein
MSKVVRVQSSDYKVVTALNGTITLDTGNNVPNFPPTDTWTGGVVVTGDLLVLGNTTTVESEELFVKDNIIHINTGETGPGVSTLGTTAGLQIERGSLSDTYFLWDETEDSFTFTDETNELRSITTNRINTRDENLGVKVGQGIITVVDSGNYEERIINYSLLNTIFEIIRIKRTSGIVELEVNQPHNLQTGKEIYVECIPVPDINTGTDPVPVTVISATIIRYSKPGFDIPESNFFVGTAGTIRPVIIINDDYIPNMKAVADFTTSAILSFNTNKILQGNSRVIVTDDSIPDQLSQISFDVDGVNQAVINDNGLFVDNIHINNNNIKNKNPNLDNILLDSVLELKAKNGDPEVSTGYVSLYSKPIPGGGGTGLYFFNKDDENTPIRDELISRSKALIYSLIL